jgi:malonate-semialdehyde dehydrogenase (acetylating)/methylmalonate-semialdehyde dehydrogenase
MTERIRPFINGEKIDSKTTKYTDVYDASTGEVIAHAPCCTRDEVEAAITAAQVAFPAWSSTPCAKRVEVLYRFRG